jgi:branched-chain amino acid aminotransferase
MSQAARSAATSATREPSEAEPPSRPGARAKGRPAVGRPAGGAPPISIQRTPTPRRLPEGDLLRFGQLFSDHMFQVDYASGSGWQRPRIVPFAPLALSPAASGLHYGQAMFDGLKAFRGVDGEIRLYRLDRHCRRLASGAARLCMPAPPVELMGAALRAFVEVERAWVPQAPGTALYLRPTLLATEPFLGVRPAAEYLFFVIASPVGAYFGAAGRPLRLAVEETMVRAAPGGLGAVKAAANYAGSLRAAEDARARGYDQVLWTDAQGHSAIEEAGTMNVFVHIDDEIATPALDGTILAGVTRDSVIALLRRWGLPVRQGRITMEQILEARRTGRLREMWGSGTAAGVAAIGELGWRGERIVVGDGGEGPLARRLGTALLEIQTGAAPDPDGWMTALPAGGAGA